MAVRGWIALVEMSVLAVATSNAQLDQRTTALMYGLLADLASIAEITVSAVASQQKPDERGCTQMLRLSMRTLRFVWSSSGGASEWAGKV